MSWLGKVLGGALGFALGGPLGALVGVALGHNFDRSARSNRSGGWADPDFLDAPDSPEFLESSRIPRPARADPDRVLHRHVLGDGSSGQGRRPSHSRRDTAGGAGDGRNAALRRPSPTRATAVPGRASHRFPDRRGPRSAPPRMPVQLPSRHHVRRDPPARGVRRRRAAFTGTCAAGIHLRAAAPPRRGAGPPRGDGARGAARTRRQAFGRALGERRVRHTRRGGDLLGYRSSSGPTAG